MKKPLDLEFYKISDIVVRWKWGFGEHVEYPYVVDRIRDGKLKAGLFRENNFEYLSKNILQFLELSQFNLLSFKNLCDIEKLSLKELENHSDVDFAKHPNQKQLLCIKLGHLKSIRIKHSDLIEIEPKSESRNHGNKGRYDTKQENSLLKIIIALVTAADLDITKASKELWSSLVFGNDPSCDVPVEFTLG